SRRRHTRCLSDWSSDVCSSDLLSPVALPTRPPPPLGDGLDRIAPDRHLATVGAPASAGVTLGGPGDVEAGAINLGRIRPSGVAQIGRASCRARAVIRAAAIGGD